MIDGNSVLAIIPARGGSKGIPRKNIRQLAGRPLIGWTIAEAKRSRYIDRFILSSEDSEIIQVAQDLGCDVPFVRPSELAKDGTPGVEPVLHALKALPEKYDYVVLLQPTSPLRIAEDIDECIEFCIKNKASTCVAVSEATQYPFWMYKIGKKGAMSPFIKMKDTVSRRQDLPKAYIINGAVYVAKVDDLLENRSLVNTFTIAYIMPKERSTDIDEELDLALCELILEKRA